MANLSNINNKFLVTTGGNVGIGVTSPGEKLDVDGNIRVRGMSATKQGVIHNSGSYFSLVSTGDTSDTTGARIWLGNNSSANAYYQNASSHYFRDLSSSIKMTLDSSGNVGIGTASPAQKLHLNNSATLTATYQKFTNGTATTGTTLGIDADGDFLINNGEAKEIKLYTNDTQRLTIQSGGNVGIGATNPFAKFEVTGSLANNWAGRFENTNSIGYGILAKINSTDSSDYIFQARTGATNVMTILGDGNVGIGTTTPDAKLTIGDPGGATTRSIQIEGNNSVSGMNGTIGCFANALYISNNYYYNSAQVHPISTYGQTNIVQQTATITGGNFIDFNVSDHTDPNNAPDTRMRILDSGNVGIGTISPSAKLEIVNSASGEAGVVDANSIVVIENNNNAFIETKVPSGNYTGIRFTDNTTSAGGVGYAHNLTSENNEITLASWSSITFRTGGIAGLFEKTERMRITSTGAISVGSTGTAYGTSGQVLTSNGNAAPTWQTPSAGGDFKTKGITLATVTSSGTTVATTVNASTVTNNSCGVIKFTMGHAANIIVVSFVVYETSNMWFVNRADEGANGNNDNDITYSGVATNTLTFKAKSSSPSSGYNGVVMIECFPPSMFTL